MSEIEEWMLPKTGKLLKPTEEDKRKAVELDLLD